MDIFLKFLTHYDLLLISTILAVFVFFGFREIHKKNYNTGLILQGYFIFFACYFWRVTPHRLFFTGYLLLFYVFISLGVTCYLGTYFYRIKHFKKMLALIGLQVVSIFFVNMVTARSSDASYILKASPFPGGRHLVVQGGASAFINHHFNYPNQKYSIDVIKICSGFNLQCSFGEQVVAVCDGIVEKITNNSDDFTYPKVDKNNPGGNFLKLKCQDGTTAYYAHLKKNSFKVVEKAKVRVGDFLALVGSSGNSSEPHLHFSIYKDNSTLQLIFKDQDLVKNSVF